MKRLSHLLLILLVFNCNTTKTNNPEEIYQNASNEFISKLLRLQKFDCDCIIQPTITLFDKKNIETPRIGYDDLVLESFNLKSKKQLDSINELAKKTNLNQLVIQSNYKFISVDSWLKIIQIKNRDKRQRAVDSMCPNGFMTMTKPIFNKTYDKVFIITNDIPYSCLTIPPFMYEKINNEWIII